MGQQESCHRRSVHIICIVIASYSCQGRGYLKSCRRPKRLLADPFQRRRNVARSLSHPRLFEYINDRIRAAYKYFAIPQTKAGPLFEDLDHGFLQQRLMETMRLLQEKAEKEDSREQSRDSSRVRHEQNEDNGRPQKQLQVTTEAIRSQGQEIMGQPVEDRNSQVQEGSASADVDSVAKSLDSLKLADCEQPTDTVGNHELHTAMSAVEEYAAKLVDSVIRQCIRNSQKEAAGADLAVDKGTAVDADNNDSPEIDLSSTEESCMKDAEDEEKDPGSSENEAAADVCHSTEATDEVSTGHVNSDNSQTVGLISNGSLIDGSAVSVVSADDLIFKFDENTLTDGQVGILNIEPSTTHLDQY